MALLQIRWKKSTIGYNQRQRETIRTLGLRRLNQVVEREDTPTVRGLVLAVRHLVEVTEVDADDAAGGQA
jgi:large subunit ribosomal protein L30